MLNIMNNRLTGNGREQHGGQLQCYNGDFFYLLLQYLFQTDQLSLGHGIVPEKGCKLASPWFHISY